ncbi:MAG: DUF167 domain-containing protein [Candidatus Saganbacteria bacterium]|nr:DUF167 domain-containing protein [Candidatus Saganbacteria bacterium]
MEWIKERKNGVTVEIKVQPQASKNEFIAEPHWLKVKLSAPPVEGKANRALVGFLAAYLRIGKKSVQILKGEKSRHKTVLLLDISKAVFISRLEGGK